MLDPAAHVPLSFQIAQLLRQQITTGKYQVGDKLPSEPSLSDTFGVAYHTVRSAIGVLREEGLVETRRGAGTYVKYIPPKITVTVGPDDRISTRMPTANERALLGLAEGVPVISVVRPGRAEEELFDGSRAEIVVGR